MTLKEERISIMNSWQLKISDPQLSVLQSVILVQKCTDSFIIGDSTSFYDTSLNPHTLP